MAVHRDENEFACDKVADTFDMKDLIGSKVKSLPQEVSVFASSRLVSSCSQSPDKWNSGLKLKSGASHL